MKKACIIISAFIFSVCLLFGFFCFQGWIIQYIWNALALVYGWTALTYPSAIGISLLVSFVENTPYKAIYNLVELYMTKMYDAVDTIETVNNPCKCTCCNNDSYGCENCENSFDKDSQTMTDSKESVVVIDDVPESDSLTAIPNDESVTLNETVNIQDTTPTESNEVVSTETPVKVTETIAETITETLVEATTPVKPKPKRRSPRERKKAVVKEEK